jgi:hypothetical protein
MKRLAIIAALLIPALACGQNMASMQGAADTVRAASTATPWYLSGGVSAANCVAAYAAKGAASLAASYDNLASAATNYNLTLGVAPLFDTSTGWNFNGANHYLNTGITPASDQSWTVIVKFSGGSSTGLRAVVDGRALSPAAWMTIFPTDGSGNRGYRHGSANALVVAGVATSGVMAIAGRTAYLNGTSDGTIDVGSGQPGTLRLGASRDAGGNPAYYFLGYVTSFAVYNATISQFQVQAIGAAMP